MPSMMKGTNIPSMQEVDSWARILFSKSSSDLTDHEKYQQLTYGAMVKTPSSKHFMVRMLDESSQILDTQILARRI